MNRREFSRLMAGAGFAASLPKSSGQAVPVFSQPSATKPRFSVMLWTLEQKGVPVEKCLETVAKAQYRSVELTNEIRDWASDGTIREMAGKIRSMGLTCDSIAGLKIVLADPSYAAKLYSQLQTHIQAAKGLACHQIILTSGPRVRGLSRERQHAACIENLKYVADLVAKNDIELVIEPIDQIEDPHVYLNSVSEGFEIVRAVGSPNIKILYDFYHEQRAGGNLIEKLERNIDWVGLVHIADVPGRHEPGTGEIDYLNIYRKLAALEYNHFIAMEYLPTLDLVKSLTSARLVAQLAPHTPSEPYKLRDV